MKLISWNVNGLRACIEKGFLEFVQKEAPDILAVQETKRMIGDLNAYGIKVKQLVINNVVPENDHCEFCKEKRNGQEKYIEYLRKITGDIQPTVTRLNPREVKGIDALSNFMELLFQ